MRRTFRITLAGLAVAIVATPLAAKLSLGVYDGWGAFRDEAQGRCYAITEPPYKASNRPFASVGFWPQKGVRAQVYFRLSRAKREGAAMSVTIGEARFPLRSGGRNAWGPDARTDAAIIAAMRSAKSMSVQGGGVLDTYRLRGAASAIDAAALSCARSA